MRGAETEVVERFDYEELEKQLAKLKDSELDSERALREITEYFNSIEGQKPTLSGSANHFVNLDNQIGLYDGLHHVTDRPVTIRQTFPEGVAVQLHPHWQGLPNEMPILLWGSIDPFPYSADGSNSG